MIVVPYRVGLTRPKIGAKQPFSYSFPFAWSADVINHAFFVRTESSSYANRVGVVHILRFLKCPSCKVSKMRESGDSHHCSDGLFTTLYGGPWGVSLAVLGSFSNLIGGGN